MIDTLSKKKTDKIFSIGPLSEVLIATAFSMLFTALYAIFAGQDINWDQRNYHIYSVYAWISNTTHWHIAPGQIQSWFNPLGYVLHYFAVQHFQPVIAGAFIGSLAGLNGGVIYTLVRNLIDGPVWFARSIGILCTIISLSASQFLSETGTTFIDNFVSIPTLIAVTLLAVCSVKKQNIRNLLLIYLISGFLFGAAAGLKLTMLIYAVAGATTLIILWRSLRLEPSIFIGFTVGIGIGYLATGGFWAIELWQEYKSPLFPFYNAIFHSPYYEQTNFSARHFAPNGLLDAISYPFQWLIGKQPAAQVPIRDGRLATFLLLLVIVTLHTIKSKTAEHESQTINVLAQKFLLTFFFVSFAVWISMFAIHRYFIPGELLIGILLFICIDRLVANYKGKVITLVLLTLFFLVHTEVSNWGRIPYGNSWYGMETQVANDAPSTIVMLGHPLHPYSYIVPFFPNTRFIRINSNINIDPNRGLGAKAKAVIERSETVAIVTPSKLSDLDRRKLDQFGLRIDESQCKELTNRIDRFFVCPAVHVGPKGSEN